MCLRNRCAIALVSFFVLAACTLELYFVLNSGHLAESHSMVARGFAFYGLGDRGYYDRVSTFELGLESFNVFFTQFLNVALLYAILRGRAWRYPLQAGVCSYVGYSTTLYLLANHLSGYPEMPHHGLTSMLIFYIPNLPWVLGNAWLVWDAVRGISAAFRRIEKTAPTI